MKSSVIRKYLTKTWIENMVGQIMSIQEISLSGMRVTMLPADGSMSLGAKTSGVLFTNMD